MAGVCGHPSRRAACGCGTVGWVERSETHRFEADDGFRKGLNPSYKILRAARASRRMAQNSSARPKTFLDNCITKCIITAFRLTKGAFLETILKRGGNAVPAGPARNRALGRLLGLAGTIIRSSRGDCVGGPGGRPLLRGSRKLLGAHKAAWSAERRAVFLHWTRVRVESADDVLTLLAGLGAPIPLGKRKRGQWVARHPLSPGGAALAARTI